MQDDHKIRVIIDTNIFISFLIGKRLRKLKDFLVIDKIELVFANQNIEELKIISERTKFAKYFNSIDVQNLIKFIKTIGNVIDIKDEPKICRDPKDNFLLGLAESSKADYLVTGDDDLLVIRKYLKTQIITLNEFEEILES